MNKRKRPNANPSGFTMVEVILFFAVSAALMLGIISGITRSISRQRYNDTVNDFAEYLRGIYSDVQAVANGETTTTEDSIHGKAGRTKNAIYGKLIRFAADGKQATSYTISGLAISSSFMKLSQLNDDPTVCSDSLGTLQLLGCAKTDKIAGDANQNSYKLIWDGKLETTPNTKTAFAGCLLVVRSPISGVVQTFFSDNANCENVKPVDVSEQSDPTKYFVGYANDADINFCVQSDDNPNSRRRNIRIKANSSNSSGVIIPELDSTDNACQ